MSHEQIKPDVNYTGSLARRRVSVSDAIDVVSRIKNGLPSATVFEHGTLQVKMYCPGAEDLQQSHTRDEVYFVVNGTGWFVNGQERHRFQGGDMLFVAAGTKHRFEQYSEDFCTWVAFYGPEGGEEKRVG